MSLKDDKKDWFEQSFDELINIKWGNFLIMCGCKELERRGSVKWLHTCLVFTIQKIYSFHVKYATKSQLSTIGERKVNESKAHIRNISVYIYKYEIR